MNIDQLKRAIKAKLKDKSDMPEWYYERMSICSTCEYNTGNIEKLSIKDKIRNSHNFGEDSCNLCTCGVSDKSSDPIEFCPRGKWLNVKNPGTDRMDITSDTNIAKFMFNNDSKTYEIDYGNVSYQGDSTILLNISTHNITDIKIQSSCGCTTANPIQYEDKILLKIQYDTERIGGFSKNVKIDYTENNIGKQTIITLKGTVTK